MPPPCRVRWRAASQRVGVRVLPDDWPLREHSRFVDGGRPALARAVPRARTSGAARARHGCGDAHLARSRAAARASLHGRRARSARTRRHGASGRRHPHDPAGHGGRIACTARGARRRARAGRRSLCRRGDPGANVSRRRHRTVRARESERGAARTARVCRARCSRHSRGCWPRARCRDCSPGARAIVPRSSVWWRAPGSSLDAAGVDFYARLVRRSRRTSRACSP